MGSMLWIRVEEFHRVVWKNIPTQPVLRVLSPLLPVLIEPPIPIHLEGLSSGPLQSIRSSCRPWKIDPDPMEESDVGVLHFKDTFQCARDRHGLRTAWSLMSCACETTVVFLPNRSMASIQTLSSMCWMCMSCRLEIHVFVDKDQHARKSELCWSLLSTS